MSMVGPRPERPELMAEIVEEIPEFVYRLKVKAGLTGYAQAVSYTHLDVYKRQRMERTTIPTTSMRTAL